MGVGDSCSFVRISSVLSSCSLLSALMYSAIKIGSYFQSTCRLKKISILNYCVFSCDERHKHVAKEGLEDGMGFLDNV